jgi:hypothetical protein
VQDASWQEGDLYMMWFHYKSIERDTQKKCHMWSQRQQNNSRSRPRYRIETLFMLTLFGLFILTSNTGLQSKAPSMADAAVPVSVSRAPSGRGMGAGALSQANSKAMPAEAICLNPLDASCWLQNAAQWIAQQIMNALQPVINAIFNGPINIVTLTPPADTYQNATVITWWQAFLGVVDLAVACLVVIGGYNAIIGQHLGMGHAAITEFLPRLIFAVGAATFSLYFLGLFIDLENALCSVALNLAGTSILTNIIAAIFQGNLLGEGLLVWMLAFVVGIMVILLGAQMAVRLALLWILLVLAGPGLACFALPQTLGYGRMWLSLTASTVLVQFFQVLTLALGGVLLTSLGASNIFHLESTLATLLICIALLYLVLRLPSIVQRFALRPMMDASSSITGAAGYVANVAPRLLALL